MGNQMTKEEKSKKERIIQEYNFSSIFDCTYYFQLCEPFYQYTDYEKSDLLDKFCNALDNDMNSPEDLLSLPSEKSFHGIPYEFIDMLKYISYVKISFMKFNYEMKDSNNKSLENFITLHKCSQIAAPLSNQLNKTEEKNRSIPPKKQNEKKIRSIPPKSPDKNEEKQEYIGLLPPYLYPLRNRNVFFDFKFLQKQYEAIKNDKPVADSSVSRAIRNILAYYKLSDLYDKKLFYNDSDKRSRYFINKASLPALIFLIQTYKNRSVIPLYVQYMIISDSIINIAVGKYYSYKDIMDLLFQTKKAFFELMLDNDYKKQEEKLSLSIKLPKEKELYSIYHKKNEENLPDLINHAVNGIYADNKYPLVEKRRSLFRMVEEKVLSYVKDNLALQNHKFLPSFVGPLSIKDEFVNTFIDFFHYRQNGYAPLSTEFLYDSFLTTGAIYGWYLIQNLCSLFFTDKQISTFTYAQGFTYPNYYENFFNY